MVSLDLIQCSGLPGRDVLPVQKTRVRAGGFQLRVLRLLDTHRLLTAAHINAVALETATRRNCEICIQRLHQKGSAVRAEPRTVGPGAITATMSTACPTRWRKC